MLLHLGFISIIFVLSFFHPQPTLPKWIPQNFPHPWNDPLRCGLPYKTWICDPDGLIDKSDYGSLQNALLDLYESKAVVDCPDGSKKGISLAVFAVDNIDLTKVCKGVDGPTECMEIFTRGVAESWRVGDQGCQNGAVLGVSGGLKSAYIVTAAGTRRVLSDRAASSIVQELMIPHFKHRSYARGILAGVNGIKTQSLDSSIIQWPILLFFFLPGVSLFLYSFLSKPVFYQCQVKVFYLIFYPLAYLIDLVRWPYVKYKSRLAQRHFERILQTLQHGGERGSRIVPESTLNIGIFHLPVFFV